jgi:hypothetical protein
MNRMLALERKGEGGFLVLISPVIKCKQKVFGIQFGIDAHRIAGIRVKNRTNHPRIFGAFRLI